MPEYVTDTIVVGAGVVGLAAARALAQAGRDVIVLETHPGIGMETSSRSSEVIHAGLYYEPGSLKARSCIRGSRMLYDYCESRGVPQRRIGKLVVAVTAAQIDKLHALRENALACGAEGLEIIDEATLIGMEPEIEAHAALWSPATGIIDSHALMLALQADLEQAGGTVATHTTLRKGKIVEGGFEISADSGGHSRIRCSCLVNAAGLNATDVAKRIHGVPAEHIPEVNFVRGHYFTYSAPSPFRQLVYPLPEAGGLGIHATLDLGGQLRFGPDTESCQGADYRFDESRKADFARSVRRWYPQLDETRLQPGYVGVRPKLAGPAGTFADFAISGPREHGIPGLVNLFGIESPGLTACLALAEAVSTAAGLE